MKAKEILAMPILLCILACACANKREQQSQCLQVKTITAKKSEQTQTLESYGSITYKKKNDICALVDGTIIEQRVIEGSPVKEGEILFELKNIQYQIQKAERLNQVNSARAKLKAAQNNLTEQERNAASVLMTLDNAKAKLAQKQEEYFLQMKNLEKNQTLFAAGGISETSMEQMIMDAKALKTDLDMLEKELTMQSLGYEERDLLKQGIVPSEDKERLRQQLIELNTESARIQIELAEVELRNAQRDLESINALIDGLTVRSPCKGIVGALYYEKGERIAQNEKIATIIDMDFPYAKVSVQEKDMEKIELGANALIQIESAAYTEQSKIDFISPLADSETGNFFIKIPVTNSKNKLRLGMFAKCSIQSKAIGEYFALPESVLSRRDGNTAYLFCVQNDYVYQKECPIEMERNSTIFVKSGISDGEKIVLNPSTSLKEGMRVKSI